MKQRFSSLDVKVIAHELSATVTSLRISNIYDLSSRIFLFKLAKPDCRKQLIVDSGFRCHLTEYSRTTATHPSHFVSRLRKYLRSRRITNVSQVGTDRIIHFEFSGRYHLFLEFYAGGNIVLTDNEYNILTLFRVVSEANAGDELRVGLKYTLSDKQNYDGIPPLSPERVKDTLRQAKEKEQQNKGATAKKPKNKSANVIRQALSLGFPEFPPLLLEHAFETVGCDSTFGLDQALEDLKFQEQLMLVLQEAENVNHRLSTTDNPTGYIVAKTDTNSKPKGVTFEDTPVKHGGLVYDDFHPFRPTQFNEKPGITILEFQGYNKTVDEFFSSAESQKLESRLTEKEENARRKLDSARKDHEKRIGALQETQELHIRKAQAIEANLYRVEEAMSAVNGLIAQGMDWVEIARLIEMEQKKQNPVAKTIKLPLKLYENTITLLLTEGSDEDEEDTTYESSDEENDESDSDEEKPGKPDSTHRQPLSIDIDLGISPWANSRQYYNQKKSVAAKQEKTLQSSTRALKSTEKKVTAALKKGLKKEKQVLRPARKMFWFEKFTFFISSDGYLVLGGRDASQIDILYRQYLKKGDVFVHADLDGAIPFVIKNKVGAPDSPIPPGTLSQAGTMSVATSVAWDSKAVIAAWWVKAEQVSKTAPTGDYLAPGNFFVRGDKNFLPPAQLVLGFAVLFHISEDSVANHTKHRVQDGEGLREEVKDVADAVPSPEKGGSEHGPKDSPNGDGENETDSEDGIDEPEEPTNPLQNDNPEQETQGEGEVSKNIYNDSDEELDEDSAGEHSDDIDGQTVQTTDQQEQSFEEEDKEESISSTPRSSTPSQNKKPSAPQTRGKKGKKKKLTTKYAHQDEEDRELALRLLGSGKKPDKAAEAAKAKAAREAEAEAQKQRRRAQHDRAAEAERQRQLAFAKQEEGEGNDGLGLKSQDLTEAEIADLECIPCLIGTPVPGDEILAAVPVCAPWPALSRCKFRTKLQPGTTKKGKAVKEMLGRWISDATTATSRSRRGKKPDTTSEDVGAGATGEDDDGGKGDNIELRELELIKGWRDVEVINTVPVGAVRIVGSGGGGDKGKGGDPKGKGNNKKGGGGKGGRGSKKKR
ncbi:hypothetical protein FQN54_001032 [Arachnomyces sp. PD_36]|nr:hypothetical protein FQN54_001032 [Arachnomyces sp. PD_36]